MSAEHAKIVCEKDSEAAHGYTVTITDCSRNGLHVNNILLEKGKPCVLKDQDVVEFPFKCAFKFQVNEGVEPNYGTPKHRLKKGEKGSAAVSKKKKEVGTVPPPSKKKEEEAKEAALPIPAAAKKRASPEKETIKRLSLIHI